MQGTRRHYGILLQLSAVESLPALLAYWEREQTCAFTTYRVPTDPIERMSTMRKLAIEIPHAAEAAIRHGATVILRWRSTSVGSTRNASRRFAQSSPKSSRIRRVDLLAVMGLGILIGVQCWRTRVDPVEFERVLEKLRPYGDVRAGRHDLLTDT